MAHTGLWDYSHPMNNKKLFFKAGKTQFILCTAFLGMLTGVIGYSDEPNHAAVNEQPSSVRAVAVVQDDYVYYPGYEVYYSRTRHQYVYPEGGGWVSRPAPRGVSVNVLMASPSVAVDFHDSPASHHTEMVKKYPRNWRQPDPDRGQTDNRKDDDRPHN
jgi:hypothetical protein